MNKATKLEDVLEGYSVETPKGNDPKILKRWMERFPEHADALLAFASDRSRVRHMPDPDLSEEEESAAMSRGLYAIRLSREISKKKPIRGLISVAEQRKIPKRIFAEKLSLSLSILSALDSRLVEFASIPKSLISSLASILGKADEEVAAYLRQPQAEAGAHYKAEIRPEPPEKMHFAELVKIDRNLTEEQRAYLLELT